MASGIVLGVCVSYPGYELELAPALTVLHVHNGREVRLHVHGRKVRCTTWMMPITPTHTHLTHTAQAIIFYLFAVVGIYSFGANDPWHFRDVPISVITL